MLRDDVDYRDLGTDYFDRTDKATFHALRHTFATRLVLYANDVEAARTVLGHSDQATTRIYVHPDEQTAQAVNKIPVLKLVESK